MVLPPPTLDRVASFDNLVAAYRKASVGRKRRDDIARFAMNWESRLLELQDALLSGTYMPSPYRVFTVHEKKTRTIMSAPFIDRVVHHAICNVLTPHLERSMSPHSCANRLGMGTRRGLELFGRFAVRYRYVLKCDIKTFFPSIDRRILEDLLLPKVGESRLAELVRSIIHAAPVSDTEPDWFEGDTLLTPMERPRGLPIGNMTSQTWANWYLNGLDHFIMDNRGFGAYVRYVDDFAVFGNDKEALGALKCDIVRYLQRLRLRLHTDKSRVYRTGDGVPFLGFRHYPSHRTIGKPNVRRFRRRIRAKVTAGIAPERIRSSIAGWAGFARMGNTSRVRARLYARFGRLVEGRGVNVPRAAWGLVEQQQREPSLREPEQQQSRQQEQQQRVSLCIPPA